MVTARPRLVLLVCVLLALLSAGLSAWRLEFRSDRSELIDTNLDFQRRYAEFRARFPRWDDAVVVVDMASLGTPANAEAYLAALEARLKGDERFSAVSAGFPSDEASPGMIFAETQDKVKAHVASIKQATVVLTAPAIDGLIGMSSLAGTGLGEAQREGLRGLLERAGAVARGESADVLGLSPGVQRLVTGSGRLATVLVALRDEASNDERIASIAALRGHLKELKTEPGFSGASAGVTGVPVLEADETEQSQRDGERAGVLSLVLIAMLMLVAYRGLGAPLMSVAALLIGVAWSFAWATVAVGHLQLLSITFASLLMGLGIDVAIHLMARLEVEHPGAADVREAMRRVFRGVGPGIVTASVTVAVGAGAMAFTRFAGVAEMGVIAAGGIMLCTGAIMCALPAMMVLFPGAVVRMGRDAGGGNGRVFMGVFGGALAARPGVSLAVGAVIAAGAGWLAWGVRYDTDLQNLMPEGSESVVWQKRLESDDARGVWHAVVLAKSVDEARDLTLRLRALPVVGDVGGVGMLFHDAADDEAKRAALRTLPDEEFVKSAIDSVQPNPAGLRRVTKALAERFEKVDPALSKAAAAVSGLDDDALVRVQNAYDVDRSRLTDVMLALRGAGPVGPEALPQGLRDLFVAPDGGLLLRVYPAARENVLSPAVLGPFVKGVLGVAPGATGPSVQIHESTRLITGAYRDAAVFSLLAIFVVLVIDFRSVADALSALVPVLLGAALMLAVMRASGMALNFANLIVMPLIVGIGVGCGVHAVRRWRLQPADPPPGLAGGSGKAITLTTLTTVFGFAALIIGEHRGIKSLGMVMSLGLAMVWAVTIFLMPALLAARGGRGAVRGARSAVD